MVALTPIVLGHWFAANTTRVPSDPELDGHPSRHWANFIVQYTISKIPFRASKFCGCIIRWGEVASSVC